jgi:hypothetical protein
MPARALGAEIEAAVARAAAVGVLAWGHDVLHHSNERIGHGDPTLDPDRAESLHRLGEVRMISPFMAEVAYPGPYAAVQHEAPFHHPRGGGAHFLELAALERASQGERLIGAAVRRAIHGR